MTDRALLDFLARHKGQGIAAIAAALREIVSAGGGFWVSPDTHAGPEDRPMTHMHELCVFDVLAHGLSAEDVVNNWMVIARRRAEDLRARSAQEAEAAATLRRRIDGIATAHAIETGQTRIRVLAGMAEAVLSELAGLDRGATANLAHAALLQGFGAGSIDEDVLRRGALDDLDIAAAQAGRRESA